MTETTEATATAVDPNELARQTITGRRGKLEYENDAFGRRIGVRWLTVSDNIALARILGPEDLANQVISAYYTAAYAVAEIHGEPVPPATSRLMLDATFAKLDNEGVAAAVKAYTRMNSGGTPEQVADVGK